MKMENNISNWDVTKALGYNYTWEIYSIKYLH